MEYAYLNHDIVRWARERSGFSTSELAGQLNVPHERMQQWERGNEFPSFGIAQDLAKLLKVPFGYLFLSNPPNDDPPIPDLRTTDGGKRRPSPVFIELLNDVLVKHDWYVDHIKELGARRLAFVGKYSIETPIPQLMSDMKDAIDPQRLRQSANSWSDYLRLLVQSAEALNILVMRAGVVRGNPNLPLAVTEFRGFAISDKFAPLIFINSRDAQAAQIFTFAHELAHIWIGQTGISDTDPARPTNPKTPLAAVESYCNQAAAEFLVPAVEFEATWRRTPGEPAVKAERLARIFKVSVPVILRRAYERGEIKRSAFFELLRGHQEKIEELEQKKAAEESESSGGNFYNTFFARNSQRLTESIISSFKRGTLTSLEASRLLNVRIPTISKLADRITG